MNTTSDLKNLMLDCSLADIHNAKILIVDDNPSNVALLEAVLEDEEYENLFSTTDPFQVLPLYLQHKFDLILLDIRMPDLSGIDVLRQFGDIMQSEYLPIIVLTAQTDQETRQQVS